MKGKSLYCPGQRVISKEGKENWDKIFNKKEGFYEKVKVIDEVLDETEKEFE